MSIYSPSIGDGDEASTADVGPHQREPTASDVTALETAMLCFEKQDINSWQMQLTNFMSFAKGAEIK